MMKTLMSNAPKLPQPGDVVYVRPILVETLPDHLRSEVGDAEIVYSVHNPEGGQLALVIDRQLAFSLAREFDLSPQSVH